MKTVKSKYEQLSRDEIESVKAAYSKRAQKIEEDPIKVEEKTDVEECTTIADKLGYSTDSNKETDSSMIYVISPDEFSELGDFKTESLTYYADKVLTYDTDEIVENINDVVGLDSLNHFGEYEDDSVFVRNVALKTDFEICLDQRNYSDVVGSPQEEDQ